MDILIYLVYYHYFFLTLVMENETYVNSYINTHSIKK